MTDPWSSFLNPLTKETEVTDTSRRLVVVVLDRSGSMFDVKEDTEGGLRAFLEAQKEAPGLTLVTLRQFDTEHDTVFENVPLAEVPAFELRPRGGTALLDAVGSTIAAVGEQLAGLEEADRPGEVVVVILTDGHENSSAEWTLDQVKASITRQQDERGWQFFFLGADQDAFAAGGRMGISRDTSLSYGGEHTSEALHSAGRAAARGSRTGDYGFTQDERTRSGLGEKGTSR